MAGRKLQIYIGFMLVLVLSTFISGGLAYAYSPGSPTVILDGNVLQFEQAPFLVNNRLLVPLRPVFEAMGAEVYWDQSNQTVKVIKGNREIFLAIGSKIVMVNKQNITLDVAPEIIHNKTFVPVRFAGEALGAKVTWDQRDNFVIINTIDQSEKDLPKIPVILVHGTMGNSVATWGAPVIDPENPAMAEQAEPAGLFARLVRAGYVPGQTLFVIDLPPDPNTTLLADTQRLIAKINTILAKPYALLNRISQVNIIGYSRGGLVGRYAAAQMPAHVKTLITIGTPHKGSEAAGWFIRDLGLERGKLWLGILDGYVSGSGLADTTLLRSYLIPILWQVVFGINDSRSNVIAELAPESEALQTIIDLEGKTNPATRYVVFAARPTQISPQELEASFRSLFAAGFSNQLAALLEYLVGGDGFVSYDSATGKDGAEIISIEGEPQCVFHPVLPQNEMIQADVLRVLKD